MLRNSLQLYREELGKIVCLGLVVVLPLQFLFMIINNYIYTFYGLTKIYIADFYYGINMIWVTSLIQIPFIKMLERYQKREYIDFSRTYKSIWEFGFVVFVMGFLYAFSVGIGTIFLIIPGLIILILFFAYPYAVVLDEKKWWKGFKFAFQFGKSNFWKLCGIIFGFMVVELAVEWIVQSITFLITDRYIVVATVVMLVNMLFVPLVTFVTGFLYQDWKKQADVAT